MAKVNCAIYVRKSTEKGLDQEFNSLHNQEQACRSYIMSQTFNGWEHYKTYIDGGISGGTMERPSLQDMIDEIKKGNIQTVVVYKVDRLSRSIIDFHNMMKNFEKYNCNFVSITQAFDTSTSMGKLTLNRHIDGSITKDQYIKKLDEIKRETEKLTQLLNDYPLLRQESIIGLEALTRLLSEAPELFKISKNEKKRQLINLLFSKLLLNGKSCLSSIRKPILALAKMGKCQEWLGRLDWLRRTFVARAAILASRLLLGFKPTFLLFPTQDTHKKP